MRDMTLEKDLAEIVGQERVTTDPFETSFYTADFVPVPPQIRRFFDTTPRAVVKPGTTEDVARVLAYCHASRLPLTVRGGGTSGLFGSVPKKGGIVLDTTGLTRIVEIDGGRSRVTVEAGMTWWQLDRHLRKAGMTVKSYPSSARSATISGWIMGTGLGIGSLAHGAVFGHLAASRIVLPDGSVRSLEGVRDLEYFCASEGMLGIMTQVTLDTRKVPAAASYHLFSSDRIDAILEMAAQLAAAEPRPFAVELFDWRYMDLLRRAGEVVTPVADGGGVLLAVYEGSTECTEEGRKVVRQIASSFAAEEKQGAEAEWARRFNMMRVRRSVPSLILSSAQVPLKHLSGFYSRVTKISGRPVAVLAHVVSEKDAIVMPMFVTDERNVRDYAFALRLPHQVSEVALSLGGKPAGGIGVWNSPYLNRVFPREKIDEMRRKKQELDPHSILNPGMWFDPPFFLKPQIHAIGMAAARILDRFLPALTVPTKGHRENTEFDLCVQCGYCMNDCPTKGQWISSTPRGRIFATKEILSKDPSLSGQVLPDYVKSVFECTLCGRCKVDCSVAIDSPPMWVMLREIIASRGVGPDSLKELTGVIEENHNLSGKNNDQRSGWTKKLSLGRDLFPAHADTVYFVGCVTAFYPMVQDIARSFVRLLDTAGVSFSLLGGREWCCGYPLVSAGRTEAAAKAMQHNLETVVGTGATRVVVTCPGCYRMWKHEYTRITGNRLPLEVLHSTQFIDALIREGRIGLGELNEVATYHDPCDLGRVSRIFDAPRAVLASVPGLKLVEMEENRDYCTCCGSGGDLLAFDQTASLTIAGRKVAKALQTGATTLITACPSCIRAITMARMAVKAELNILDIVQVVERVARRP